ncbi:uncharacterized protein LOC103940856 isoform X2 [Pyrus x bretschneideri]|uniref:uncharacterized protein LOC125468608 isoform X2 n=1 Tax=Pyrus x bretschneideri TaxID=225117 RepID=UPI00202E0F36|nr:uncharacterized protein LOC125468608 isoform X2 [Pyrus x bretschneideri]XP_048420580.1 uncharacterized protein LOC103940856 isoform X2 [Pyrus x bretschneideri]
MMNWPLCPSLIFVPVRAFCVGRCFQHLSFFTFLFLFFSLSFRFPLFLRLSFGFDSNRIVWKGVWHVFLAVFHERIALFQVLHRFLENYCISLNGPVCKSSLPDIVAKAPKNERDDLLLSEEFIRNCVEMFSVPAKGNETNLRAFSLKHLNLIATKAGQQPWAKCQQKYAFSLSRSHAVVEFYHCMIDGFSTEKIAAVLS